MNVYISDFTGDAETVTITILEGQDAVLPCDGLTGKVLQWYLGTLSGVPEYPFPGRIARINPVTNKVEYDPPFSELNAELNTNDGSLTLKGANLTNQSPYTCFPSPVPIHSELIINGECADIFNFKFIAMGISG